MLHFSSKPGSVEEWELMKLSEKMGRHLVSKPAASLSSRWDYEINSHNSPEWIQICCVQQGITFSMQRQEKCIKQAVLDQRLHGKHRGYLLTTCMLPMMIHDQSNLFHNPFFKFGLSAFWGTCNHGNGVCKSPIWQIPCSVGMGRYHIFADTPISTSADMPILPISILPILKNVPICWYFRYRYQYRPIPTVQTSKTVWQQTDITLKKRVPKECP